MADSLCESDGNSQSELPTFASRPLRLGPRTTT